MKGVKRIDLGRDVPAQVAEWLDDAAFTLAAMPANGCWPGGMRSYWPDIVADREDLDWPMESDIRPPVPSSDEVSRMDLALSWVPMVTDRGQKAVVNMRLIVHPISGQHRWTWRKIGRKLGVDHHTAKGWHAEACSCIARKIVSPAFFTSHIPHFEHM
ncbi:DUF6362 family protein [Gluconobacter oxydans]|uniref:DUF6362 family protein n=1 Tax=Gluconobacter oxydans TaxID=442 RepID=UPI0039ECFD6F